MSAKADDIIARFNALTTPLVDRSRYAKPYNKIMDEVTLNKALGSTGAQRMLVDEDKRQMNEVADDIAKAFNELESTIHGRGQQDIVNRLKLRALERFDEIASLTVGVRGPFWERSRLKEDSPLAHAAADNRPLLRHEFEAKLDLAIAKRDTQRQREKDVRMIALRTSLAVSLTAAVLSSAVNYAIQIRREHADIAIRRDDRRYQKREALRSLIVPSLFHLQSSTFRVMQALGAVARNRTDSASISARTTAISAYTAAARSLDTAYQLNRYDLGVFGELTARDLDSLRQQADSVESHFNAYFRQKRYDSNAHINLVSEIVALIVDINLATIHINGPDR